MIGLFDEVEAIYVNDYMIKRIDRKEEFKKHAECNFLVELNKL